MLDRCKIAHFGNMANDAYPVVSYLRKAGVEADLYVNKASHVTGLPQWEEVEVTMKELRDPYGRDWEKLNKTFQQPSWLHWIDLKPVGNSKINGFTNMIHNILLIRKKMRKYDLVIAHVPFFLYAQFAGVSYLAFEAGTIRQFPSTERYGEWDRYDRFRFSLMSRSYRHAHDVMLTNPDTITLAQKMGLQYTFTRFLIDTERYKPISPKDPFPYEYVVFSPSRQIWRVRATPAG